MAYQTSTSMRRYGRGSGTSLRTYARDCVCDSGREWCCAGRSSGLRGDDEAISLRTLADSDGVSLVSGVALTYHGYKRTGSVLWALVYGAIGKTVPLVAVPVAFAQGFGKKKEGC